MYELGAKNRGKKWTTSGLSVIMHAQDIAVLTSTDVQKSSVAPRYVASIGDVVSTRTSCTRRRTETMQTLPHTVSTPFTKTKGSRRDSQESQCENPNNSKLLLPRQRQGAHYRHRQQHNDKVRKQMQPLVCPPQINRLAVNRLLPRQTPVPKCL